ncbi:MAG: RnfABCDGE type electron transport complex subunit B [Bacteroidales bacterium]|nr:RnfABCDGE type electron transport complex subunit B [Bacteroidales bacterium]
MEQQYLAMTVLGAAGFAAGLILYIVAKKFNVKEDARIGQIEEILPGANCGACGRKGCHDFAVECCRTGSIAGLTCPGAGPDGMARIAGVLGIDSAAQKPKKAYVRCNGTCANRLVTRNLDSIPSCVAAKSLAMPEGYCTWGCLGKGDCVKACNFNAMAWDTENGMPIINADNCVGCGACATACPQNLILIREVDAATPVVVVKCSNRDKGAAARKMCTAACIGCGKCTRTCRFGAIKVTDNVASIDPALCTGCGECAAVCPTHAIHLSTTDL